MSMDPRPASLPRQDRPRQATALLEGLPPAVAGRGYDWQHLIDLGRPVWRTGPPSHPMRPQAVNPTIYHQPNLVDAFFCKLKHSRPVATRYDKLARNFLATTAPAAARLWMRVFHDLGHVASAEAPRSQDAIGVREKLTGLDPAVAEHATARTRGAELKINYRRSILMEVMLDPPRATRRLANRLSKNRYARDVGLTWDM